MDYQKEKEFFMVLMVIAMKVNGEMIKKKEKEFFIGIMNLGKVIDMKEIGEIIKKKEKEFIIIMMVKDTKAIIEMAC